MAALGLPTYAAGALRKVPAHMRRKPARSFSLATRLGPRLTGFRMPFRR